MLRPFALTAILSSGLASAAAAQLALAACPAKLVIGDLGIDAIECHNCEIHGRPRRDESWIRFHGEPKVRSIRPGGAAEGKIQAEDLIVSIDAMGITTAEGSDRYSRPEPGQVVHLGVRRGDQELDVEITAAPFCGAPPSPRVIKKYIRNGVT